MAANFDHLIADLDAAKADLARTVRRCRTLLDERRSRLPPVEAQDRSIFIWPERKRR